MRIFITRHYFRSKIPGRWKQNLKSDAGSNSICEHCEVLKILYKGNCEFKIHEQTMTGISRPDLDGCSIIVPAKSQVWLVFHGMRHHVENHHVFNALFRNSDKIKTAESVEDILQGPVLNDGSCLVRGEGHHSIFLVTGYPAMEVRRHHIISKAAFEIFGFDEQRVKNVPQLVLIGLVEGPPLQASFKHDL